MSQSSTQTISLQAPDISCGHCVSSIQNRLSGLDGVQNVTASADTKLIDLEFNPSQITLDKIKAELDDEGYPVT